MNQSPLNAFYRGRRVLVTGHTGFKGAWLYWWLHLLGAKVYGLSLEPDNDPNLFTCLGLQTIGSSYIGDIRDRKIVDACLSEAKPEIVFHLAAQALVRKSYETPVETLETNVIGTANLLDSLRKSDSAKACVVITSDKCYENKEWDYPYRENDPMGGVDPYSMSKGCTELVVDSFRRSYFAPLGSESQMGLGSMRAGNVIGGGDWSEDRLMTDCFEALTHGKKIELRNPKSVRPWQFVLDPLSAYLWLGLRLCQSASEFSRGWNVAPNLTESLPVADIVSKIIEIWGQGEWLDISSGNEPHEARILRLDPTLTATKLGWRSNYSIEDALLATVSWYKGFYSNNDFVCQEVCKKQIIDFMKQGKLVELPWAVNHA